MKKIIVSMLFLLCVSCDAKRENKVGDESSDPKPVAVDPTLNFGDSSSTTLTAKAWQALEEGKYDDAITFAKTCVETYETEAMAMQESLDEPIDPSNKEAVFDKWALNDVGTCYYIMGQALEKQDKGSEAMDAYQQLLDKVSFAQCWDANGWFWKPADAAKKQIKVLEFEAMESEGDDALGQEL